MNFEKKMSMKFDKIIPEVLDIFYKNKLCVSEVLLILELVKLNVYRVALKNVDDEQLMKDPFNLSAVQVMHGGKNE